MSNNRSRWASVRSSDLVLRAVRLFKCDEARITSPCGTHFLILGWKARSEGEWRDQNGKPVNFDYLREQVVASGKTLRKLWQSVKHYKRLLDASTQNAKVSDGAGGNRES